jgi:hypothetical protein
MQVLSDAGAFLLDRALAFRSLALLNLRFELESAFSHLPV